MGFADFGIYTLMTLLGIVVVLVFTMLNAAYLTYYERKVMGHMQARVGPMHTGPHGLLQPLADGLKLFFKEDIIPAKADRKVFVLAPLMALVPALIAYAVVPFGPEMTIFGYTMHLYVTDLNIGILYVLALSSLGAYGIIMAGWSSNSKYALMGGLRSASQVISYEIPMGLAIISVLMMTGSLSLVDITKGQAHLWNIVYQPVAFIIYMISGHRRDEPRAFRPAGGGERTGGRVPRRILRDALRVFLHGGIREHAHGLVHRGGALPGRLEPHNPAPVFEMVPLFGQYLGFLGDPAVWWFIIKIYAFFFLFLWIRATLPRLRYDQLMRLGWKILIPLGLLNILVTGLIKILVQG